EGRGYAGGATDEVRVWHQSHHGKGPRSYDASNASCARRRGDRMRRCEFIALLGGAAAWPFAVHAQQPATRPLIGVLSALSPTAAKRNIEGLREGLRALGYVEGRNVSLELRFAEGVGRTAAGTRVRFSRA